MILVKKFDKNEPNVITFQNGSKIQKVDYGQILINCKCGEKYFSDRGRFHKCPKCNKIWDLKCSPGQEPYLIN